MKFLDIGNIVLTKGESSDLYEISSDTSLSDYKGKLRISNQKGIILEEDLKHSPEIKNNDNIFDDDLIINYKAEKFDFSGGVQDETQPSDKDFIHKIKINEIQKDRLTEEATISGKVYKTEFQDTIVPGSPNTLVSQEVEIGLKDVKVIVSLTSETKEITREASAFTNADGDFNLKIFLGETIKQPANQNILFQISSSTSESLDAGRYFLTLTIFKEELDKTISFQKEVLQTKLDINERN